MLQKIKLLLDKPFAVNLTSVTFLVDWEVHGNLLAKDGV